MGQFPIRTPNRFAPLTLAIPAESLTVRCPQPRRQDGVSPQAVDSVIAILSVLLGCGLRRAELVSVRIENMQIRKDHWVIADLLVKGPSRARSTRGNVGEATCG